MKEKANFNFFTKRIDYPNPETNFFQLLADSNFISVPQDVDLKRDEILLRFEQKIWEYDIKSDEDNINIFNSYYKKVDNDYYYMHDIYYQEVSKSKLKNSRSCPPTLSFRTLIIDNHLHIKFGLPVFYGNSIRIYPINEALASMYISDCIRNTIDNNIVDFFFVDKIYYFNNHSDYCIAHRIKSSKMQTIPIGNYFNGLLYFSKKDKEQRFKEAMKFVKLFLFDLNKLIKEISQIGLGLEIHGQNLLVYVDSNGNPIHRYLYRDFGHCTISQELYYINKDINNYYQEKYNFNFQATGKMASHKIHIWQSFRTFILGFLFYNLDRYSKINNIFYNVYEWGDDIIKKCSILKDIY